MAINLEENVLLAGHSSLGVGGLAKYFKEVKSVEELIKTLSAAREERLRVFVLGSGTNVLWSDKGFNGLVVKPNIRFIERAGDRVKAGAGTEMGELVDFTVENSLAGLDWAGGLPGTFGGAIFGNAGCFGGEIKDAVEEVESVDIDTLETKRRSNKECRFAYRSSVFKAGTEREVITQATLALKPGDREALRGRVEEQKRYRRERQPLDMPNLGSFFKNVDARALPAELVKPHREFVKEDPLPVIPAAHLIHAAGLKGLRSGGAMVSPKHPNFLVNTGGAKTADFLSLMTLVKKGVKEKFGIELEEEIKVIE